VFATYKGDREIPEIAAEYGVYTNQVRKWKMHLLEAGVENLSNFDR
jgi:hypothetical protein